MLYRNICCCSCCFKLPYFPIQEPVEEQEEVVIQPGGDPDAGMPADQAEIHGTERHPIPDTEHENESVTIENNDEQGDPPIADSIDNIDEDNVNDDSVGQNKHTVVTQPPDSD